MSSKTAKTALKVIGWIAAITLTAAALFALHWGPIIFDAIANL